MMSVDIRLIYGAWVSRITFPIAISVVLFILKKEYKKRIDSTAKKVGTCKYQKSLDFWSLSTILLSLSTLFSFFIHKIPSICNYNYGLFESLWVLTQATLTFYQIARLEYCFSAKRIHSEKYGYSDLVFKVLYMNGFLYMIYVSILTWFSYHVTDLGCYGCEIVNSQLYYILVPIATVWFYAWDWTVLSMYFYKMYQLKKHKIFDNPVVYSRVKFIMNKIVLLTVIYEIKVVLIVLLNTILLDLPISSILIPVFIMVDVISTVVIIYLMVEHNNDEFIITMKRCCCCCSSFIHRMEQLQASLENNEVNQTENQDNITGYTSDSSVFQTENISESIRPTTMRDVSENTKTAEAALVTV